MGALGRAQGFKGHEQKTEQGDLDKLEHERLSGTFRNRIKEAKVRNKPGFPKVLKTVLRTVNALLGVRRRPHLERLVLGVS